MKLELLLVGLAVAQAAFYGREVETSDGQRWRILNSDEMGETACDARCGEACLSVTTRESVLSYLEADAMVSAAEMQTCFEFCGCVDVFRPVQTAPEVSATVQPKQNLEVSCEHHCALVCESQSAGCYAKCSSEFCPLADDSSSVLLAVVVDLLVLVVLLGMFYFAYVYTPTKPKRAAYWRRRIAEAQYTRLGDY